LENICPTTLPMRPELIATGSGSITCADTPIKLILNIDILNIKKGLADKHGKIYDNLIDKI
jgi:hypothetical protein